MPSVEEHYQKLLAPYYSWIQGGAEHQLTVFRSFFGKHVVCPGGCGIAVDLGAGSGFQSIPLAESGFEVIAIDVSRELLDELRRRAGALPIHVFQEDLLDFSRHCPPQVELIACMGDTLTHLNTLEDVQHMIDDAHRNLATGGRLLLGFRDMSIPAEGLDRFFAVRSSADRIFTCFLEYEKRHVKVHDLIHERVGDQWQFRKSFFRKLRISSDWLLEQIQNTGLKPEHADLLHNGMTTIIARKP